MTDATVSKILIYSNNNNDKNVYGHVHKKDKLCDNLKFAKN